MLETLVHNLLAELVQVLDGLGSIDALGGVGNQFSVVLINLFLVGLCFLVLLHHKGEEVVGAYGVAVHVGHNGNLHCVGKEAGVLGVEGLGEA